MDDEIDWENWEDWEDVETYTWGYGDVNVMIHRAHRWGEYGRCYHRYILQSGSEVIFEGDDFSPSPMYGHEVGDAHVASLLGFLTIKPGDTDDEYFKDHTLRQLEWVESMEAETLSYMASDYEERGTWEYEDA